MNTDHSQQSAGDFRYNSHREYLFDDIKLFPSLSKGVDNAAIAKFDTEDPTIINHGTILALIVHLTSPDVIDYNLICDFFLTYRSFTDSAHVLLLLLTRLSWALHYSNTPDSLELGKLVLLRTFVVLRHWISNYFVDDFLNNPELALIFINMVNGLSLSELLVPRNDDVASSGAAASGSISNSPPSSKSFEIKIISNLKIHWISAVNEFLNAEININSLISSKSLISYNLPKLTDLKNSSNEGISIHTNPSFRRSAMLSLYDKQIHKCLIYDDDKDTTTENPQYSINNLLLQHQSSRISLQNKLNEFRSSPIIANPLKFTDITNTADNKNQKSKTKKSHTSNHKYLDLKDNSWQLNSKITPIDEEPVQSSPNRLTTTGFSTNGNIKLPSSKVISILPSTPVKKMDDFSISYNKRDRSNTATGSPIRSFASNDIDRKKSIKRFMDSFKLSKPVKINSNTSENTNYNNVSTSNPNQLQGAFQVTRSASINSLVSEADKFTLSSNTNPVPSIEENRAKIGARVDILSARIIDELEYLIRHYIKPNPPKSLLESNSYRNFGNIDESTINFINMNENIDETDRESNGGNPIVDEFPDSFHNDSRGIRMSTDLGSPIKRAKRSSIVNRSFQNEVSIIDENTPDLSDLNIGKIDNIVNKDERNLSYSEKKQILPDEFLRRSIGSFKRPVSINWNEDVDLDKSSSPSNTQDMTENSEDNIMSNRNNDEFLASLTEDTHHQNTKLDHQMVKSTTQYFDVSSELPPQNLTYNEEDQSIDVSSVSTPSNITQYDADIADLDIALSPVTAKKQAKRISFVERTISHNSMNSGFRRDSVKSYLSYDSAFSVSVGSAGSHVSDFDAMLRKKHGFNNLRGIAGMNSKTSGDFALDIKTSSLISYNSRSSSFRPSVRLSNLYALTELPFNDIHQEKKNSILRSSKLTELADSSVFSIVTRSRKGSVKAIHDKKGSSTSNNSAAIPGISNYVLKELAAIPDESYQSINDPVQFALSKLEGKNSKASMKVADEDVETTIEEHADDTQAILNEINNAQTEDYITLSHDELSQELPLTPIKKRSKILSMSTPDFSEMKTFNSPKVILDNYHISDNLLNIEHVIKESSHISFVLSYSSKTLADHFTMIEKDMLQEVDWKELIDLKWNKSLEPVNSWLDIIVNDKYYFQNKGVNLVIARFNLMVNWIISEIVLTKHQEERIAIISRFIHVAQNCYSLQNYSSLMQIILALTSEKVQKLKETWKNLAPGDILMLKSLEELASPLKNFLNMRICINKIKPSKGCIPFVGLYLSDLVFNAERPTFIKQKPNVATNAFTSPIAIPAQSDVESTISSLNSKNELEKIVNFSKFRTAVHIVKSLSQNIEWASNYKVSPNQELLSKCLYIKSLDEEEMNYCIDNVLDC